MNEKNNNLKEDKEQFELHLLPEKELQREEFSKEKTHDSPNNNPHNPNSIFSEAEQTFPKILANSFYQGLPTSFTYGDFYYCMIAIRLILSSTGQLSLLAASAYSTSYFAICMHCLITATVDTNSTLGSQAFGQRNYKKLNLYFKQSIFVCFSLALVFSIVPSFFVGRIFVVFGAQEDLIESTRSLIYCSLPGLLVRILGDNLKVYIQNQGKMQEIGRKSFLIFCFFVPLAILLVGVYRLGATGIGICLFLYELSCSQLCLWIINKRCPVNPFKASGANEGIKIQRIEENLLESGEKDQEDLSFSHSLPAYYSYTAKVFVTRIGDYICWDSISIIVGLLNSKEELAAFGIAYLLGITNDGTSRGVIAYNATIINEKLGKVQPSSAYKLYLKCFRVVIVTGFTFAATFLAICLSMIFFGGFEDPAVGEVFSRVVPLVVLHCFQACLYSLTLKMFYSLGYFNLAIFWQGFDFVLLGCNYWFTYRKGYGAPSAYLMPNIALMIKNALGILYLQWRIDWGLFSGF